MTARFILPHLRPFCGAKTVIARAGLTPYNVARKRGELKYILLTESQSDGGMMLRFVLRSETKLAQLRKALPWLQEQLPQLKVITVNIRSRYIWRLWKGRRRSTLLNNRR